MLYMRTAQVGASLGASVVLCVLRVLYTHVVQNHGLVRSSLSLRLYNFGGSLIKLSLSLELSRGRLESADLGESRERTLKTQRLAWSSSRWTGF